MTAGVMLASWDVLTQLLDCAVAGVDHEDDLALSRTCIVPGQVAWDNCCGQLTVSEIRRFPSNSFPAEEIDHQDNCGAPYVVLNVSVTLLRCAPGSTIEGVPPTCEALQASAEQLNKDMGDLRRAVECCLSTLYNSHQLEAYELGAQEILGPQGGCVGSVLTVLLAFGNGCGCS